MIDLRRSRAVRALRLGLLFGAALTLALPAPAFAREHDRRQRDSGARDADRHQVDRHGGDRHRADRHDRHHGHRDRHVRHDRRHASVHDDGHRRRHREGRHAHGPVRRGYLARPHYSSHHGSHYRSYRAPVRYEVHGYYCRACRHHFRTRDHFHHHVHVHHHIPLWQIPFVIVFSVANGFYYYG